MIVGIMVPEKAMEIRSDCNEGVPMNRWMYYFAKPQTHNNILNAQPAYRSTTYQDFVKFFLIEYSVSFR